MCPSTLCWHSHMHQSKWRIEKAWIMNEFIFSFSGFLLLSSQRGEKKSLTLYTLGGTAEKWFDLMLITLLVCWRSCVCIIVAGDIFKKKSRGKFNAKWPDPFSVNVGNFCYGNYFPATLHPVTGALIEQALSKLCKQGKVATTTLQNFADFTPQSQLSRHGKYYRACCNI